MNNIAIIGVGALGKRHLQSMMDLHETFCIFAVEINNDAVIALKTEFPQVHFVSSVKELPSKIEVVVIATNSSIRRQVFEDLISSSSVSSIIFEKVLFQKDDDYYAVQEKLRNLEIRAWVNCARREWDSYKGFKEEIYKSKEIHLYAVGGKWGMGSSAIHILDLIEFLSEHEIESIQVDKLDQGIEESKRKGFYEFYGTITGSAGKCKSYNITCIHNSNLPFRIEITTESKRYMIDEAHSYIIESNYESQWEWNKKEFRQVYQSQMTGRVIKSIVETGNCNLADYESSMKLHLKYITALIPFFKSNGWEEDSCPIT